MLSKKSFSRLHAVFYSRLHAAKYSLTVPEYSTVTVHLTKDRKMCLPFFD